MLTLMGEGGAPARLRALLLGAGIVVALALGGGASADRSKLDHGALDPTFARLHGQVMTPIGEGDAAVQAVAVLSDGRILAAGSSSNGSDDDFALVRYRTGGALDGSFGVAGEVATAVGPGDDDATALAMVANGKIVLAGSSSNGSDDDFALVRYNGGGSVDGSFGAGGQVRTSIGSGNDRPYAIAAQSDGKLVVAGSSFNGSDDDFAVVRYNADGSLDTSFGTGGVVTTPVGPADDVARAIAITNGKLVVAGSSSNGSDDDFAVARYNADGSLDVSFGTSGVVTTPVGPGNDVARAIAITNGKLVVAGSSFNGSDDDFAVARYDGNGSLDTSLGSDGVVTTPVGPGNDVARALTITSGKLVVTGSSSNGANDDFAVLRYNGGGSLDGHFGSGGKVVRPFGTGDDEAFALKTMSDGKIVVGGSAEDEQHDEFAIMRLKSNGSLDTNLTAGGTVTTRIGSGDDRAYAVALQPDGKYVAAGSTWNGSSWDFALVRERTDGSPDSGFGTGGAVVTAIGPGDGEARAIAVQPNGRLVVAGFSWNGSNRDFALVRYNQDGSPDASFGSGGVVTTPIGSGDDQAYAVLVQRDGRIVATGSTSTGSTDEFALVRYAADGTPDPTFGVGGVVTTPIATGSVARAVIQQRDGRLIVAGSAANGSDDDFALVRYNTDGSPDASFGIGGVVTTPVGPGNDEGYALATGQSRLYLAGTTSNGSDDDVALVRYQTNGTLDAAFGGDGIATTPIGPGDDEGYALNVQRNGKPIVGGSSWNGSDRDFALVRYETNGSLDVDFGSGGKVRTAVGPGDDEIRALVEQSDGRLIAAGSSFNGTDADVAWARYHLCGKPTC
jgi:uncharacterized delta-60 repeat protein